MSDALPSERAIAVRPYVVFVDLDGTLLRTSSALLIARHLLGTGRLSFATAASILVQTFGLLLGVLDARRFFALQARRLEGLRADRIVDFHRDWYDALAAGFLRASVVAAIARHRSHGARVVLLSSAPEETCAPFVRALGLDDVLCSRLEYRDGRCSGTFAGRYCHGDEKVARANAYLEAKHHSLDGAFFYGDSYPADFPMLAHVPNPVCVAPDRRLRRHALEAAWPVLEA